MERQRWAEIESIYHAALAKQPQERSAFLEGACAGDATLRDEVESLLHHAETPLPSPFEHADWEAILQTARLVQNGSALPPFQPNQLVADRFEIIREIGAGGMGVVYEAFDRKRNLRVALKAAKPGFQRLLSPELEGALTVRHPNVCRVNEIHTAHTDQGDVDFLTMELLAGETLAERLKRCGPLTEKEAMPIARQICAGLAEAHRSAVIHRDLKTANIFLCPNEDHSVRAVITDFGLAGAAHREGEWAGTPGYMAPELLNRESASIASDIYALGVTLHHMVAATAQPGPEQTKGLSARWNKTIGHCLDQEPEKRPRSADEVIAGLEGKSTYKLLWLAVPLAASLVFLSAQVRNRVHDFVWTPPALRLLVLPAGGASKNDLARGVLQDVANRLSHLRSGARSIDVIGPEQAQELAVQAPAQAQHVGATHILQTTIVKEKDDVVVSSVVVDARTHAHIRDFSSRYTPDLVGAIPAALTGEVTEALGLIGGSPETLAFAATAPYDKALLSLQQDSQADEETIRLFSEAAGLDPRSPLPLAGLVEAEIKSFNDTKDRSHLTQATQYLETATHLNPDSARVHLAAGKLDFAKGDYEKAREQDLRVEELEPGNMDALIHLAKAYSKLNMPEKALATYQEAVHLHPELYEPYLSLGVFYHFRGQYDAAAEQFKKATERAPQNYRAFANLGVSLNNAEHYKEAENALRRSLEIRETADAINNMGIVLAAQGRDAEAIPYYKKALDLNPHQYLQWMNLGDSHLALGHARQANEAYRQGMALALAELNENPSSGYAHVFVGYFAARLGDRMRAESDIRQALQQAPGDARVIYHAVTTLELLHLRDEALAALRDASPEVLHEMERDPKFLGDFVNDSRFKKIVAEKTQRRQAE